MKRSPYWVLAFSLLGISFAGPLVRLSQADAVTIAVWRLGFSLVIVAFFLLATGEWRQLRTATSRDAGFAVFAGVALALHFWAWNASIHLTTIAASVTLVSLQPAVIAATSALVLRESPTRRQLTGIAVAILGAFIIAVPAMAGGFSAGNNPLLGNVLAISAALTAAMYYTIGRSLRAHLGLWSYVAIVYAAAFATLIVIAVVRGIAIAPQPAGEIRIFVALAVGPMLLGHTGMNWALKYLPAY
ncbi:MAG TPA: DMT family transporter, partial [Gemmatimonadaceae bacterium]|nr:DMT family transporter [Gemmatimonadaceae bacterium]